MLTIPNIIPIHEDELLYSYLMRTADANGFAGRRKDFFDTLLQPICGHTVKPMTDSMECMIPMLQLFEPYLDAGELIIHHTPLAAYLPIMSRFQQMQYLNNICYESKDYPILNKRCARLAKHVYGCPECMKEEQKQLGHHYIHVSHQVNGLKACPLHHVPLQRFVQTQDIINPRLDTLEDCGYEINQADCDYADFVYDYLQANIFSDIDVVKTAMKQEYVSLGYNMNTAEKYIEKLAERGLDKLFQGSLESYLSNNLYSHTKASFEITLPLLYAMFGTAEKVKEKVQKADRFVAPDGYEVLKDNGYLVKVLHKDDNLVATTTPYGFERGWRCPEHMPKNEKQLFEQMVEVEGRGEFKVLKGSLEGNNSIRLQHKNCRQSQSLPYGRFFENTQKCSCETKIDKKKAQQRIHDASRGEFELLEFNGIDASAVFKHVGGCNESFHAQYHGFDYKCPICTRTRTTTAALSPAAMFEYRVKVLAGDEYTVVEPAVGRGNAIVRHNTCGKEFPVRPERFINGYRCPDCTGFLTEEQFRDYLEKRTSGEYKLISMNPRQLRASVVENTDTGEQYRFNQERILQELSRPTPSDVLPVKKLADVPQPTGKVMLTDAIMSYIKKNYAPGEEFEGTAVFVDGYKQSKISATMSHLVKKGKLERVTVGRYRLPEDK